MRTPSRRHTPRLRMCHRMGTNRPAQLAPKRTDRRSTERQHTKIARRSPGRSTTRGARQQRGAIASRRATSFDAHEALAVGALDRVDPAVGVARFHAGPVQSTTGARVERGRVTDRRRGDTCGTSGSSAPGAAAAIIAIRFDRPARRPTSRDDQESEKHSLRGFHGVTCSILGRGGRRPMPAVRPFFLQA